jgi:hypothetical protein
VSNKGAGLLVQYANNGLVEENDICSNGTKKEDQIFMGEPRLGPKIANNYLGDKNGKCAAKRAAGTRAR